MFGIGYNFWGMREAQRIDDMGLAACKNGSTLKQFTIIKYERLAINFYIFLGFGHIYLC